MIVHLISFVYPVLSTDLKKSWKEICIRNLCTSPKLERKLFWHQFKMISWLFPRECPVYLQAVVNSASPDYCFDEDDKIIAKLLLQKFVWCEQLYASCDRDPPSSSPVPGVPVVSGTFSPDGFHLACFKSDGTVSIWNAHHGQIVQRFLLHKNMPVVFQWSKRFLWILYSSHILLKYPVDKHLKINVCEARHYPINCAIEKILTSSEDVIIFGCPNGSVNILDVNNDELKPFRLPTSSQSQPTECAAVSRSGSYIFTCGGEEFQIWQKCSNDAPGYKTSGSYNDSLGYLIRDSVFGYYNRRISCRACCINSDKKLGVIVCGGDVIQVCLVDMRSCSISKRFFISPARSETLFEDCFASSSFLVICTAVSRNTPFPDIRVVDIESGKSLVSLYDFKLARSGRNHIFFSSEGNVLAILNKNGCVSFIKIHVPK